jgi:hypothetical protein
MNCLNAIDRVSENKVLRKIRGCKDGMCEEVWLGYLMWDFVSHA